MLKEKTPLPEKIIRPVLSGAVAFGLQGCAQNRPLNQKNSSFPEENVIVDNSLSTSRYNLVFPDSTSEISTPTSNPTPVSETEIDHSKRQAPLSTPQISEAEKEDEIIPVGNLTLEVVETTTPQKEPVTTLAEVIKEGDYIYTVQSGDSLSKIAQEHGISLDSLIQANPQIENINLLSIGRGIIIPGQGEIVNALGGPEREETGSKNISKEVVLSVPIDAQDHSLSCESSASAMVAVYFEPQPPEDFKDWEEYFVKTIPLNCNPHRGFRGLIDGYLSTSCESPNGYGVYAEPLQEAFDKVGIESRVEYGVDYNQVAEVIRSGYPVIVWVSGKDLEPEYEVDPETGQKYTLILGEHVWTVIGVSSDNSSFLINDPWLGRQFWRKSFPSWEDFGGMRLVFGKAETNASENLPSENY